MVKKRDLSVHLVVAVLTLLAACSDSGTNPQQDPPPAQAAAPAITSIFPDSARSGDILTVQGNNFGDLRGTSTLRIGGTNVTEFISWTNTQIRARVPSGAATGSVEVVVGGRASNTIPVRIISAAPAAVSFSTTILPRFQSSCVGCHGGTNNLFLDSYAGLMAGTSRNGPVVTPGNGEGSLLVRVLRGTAVGIPRMPQGGPFLSSGEIDNISLWITQGALNN